MNQDIVLQKIYDVIRHESAVLWVGAGLSFSAGYPSGKTLRDLIFQQLTGKQKKIIDKSLSLPDLAEEFERINESRNKLLLLIEKIFEKVPDEVSPVHSQLSKIFHFDSIITTNYDHLIEDAYDFKCQVIRPKDPISSLNPQQVQVFKVHGDFEDKKNLVLTSSDYNKFFQDKKEDEGLWTIIKSKFYTKHIVFIGYNLEDSNVSVLFNRIVIELNSHKKECFLIAPNLETYKIKTLEKRGVTYYNSTGEDFIDKLVDHLNRNIWKDFENGVCSMDTFSKTASYRNVAFDIRNGVNGYKIRSLSGLNDKVKTRLKMVFSKDSSIADQLGTLVSGETLQPIKLDAKLFDKLELKVGELFWGTGNDFQDLIIKRAANHKTKADFIFGDNWEFNGIDLEFYGGQKHSHLKVTFKSAEIILKSEDSNGTNVPMEFSYKHSEICVNIVEEIELYSFLKRISNGEKFEIFLDNKSHKGICLGRAEEFYVHTCKALEQFQKLKKIEDFYKIKFRKILTLQITEEVEKKIDQIITFIDQIPQVIDNWTGELTANIDLLRGKRMKTFKKEVESNSSLFCQDDSSSRVSIFDKELKVGYSYSIIEKPIISLLESNNNTCKISIKSRSNILKKGFLPNRITSEE
jgi:hypothetical protein